MVVATVVLVRRDLRSRRPSFGNRSRGVDDPDTREAVAVLVARLVRR